MDKIEATLEGLITTGTTATNVDPRIENLEKSIAAIAQAQYSTKEAIKKVISGQGEAKKTAKKLAETVLYNKIQADEDHKIMTHAMKLFQESLIQSQTMINALQRGRESPTRKRHATSNQPSTHTEHQDSDDSSFNSTKMGPLSVVSRPDNSFQSDTNMDGAADEN